MSDDRTYRILKLIAVLGAILLVGNLFYEHYAGMGPGDIDYIDGNSSFKDRDYKRAAEYYRRALKDKPDHVLALHSLANTYVQLQRYDEALAAITLGIKLRSNFAGFYAIRGIIHDHMGKYGRAIADYERSLKMDPEVADGMHWLDRLLHNVQEKPPTVADRLAYLKRQMKLPVHQRVLSKPALDTAQRPYEQ